eukprot:2031829-Amphidinium_carterae.1
MLENDCNNPHCVAVAPQLAAPCTAIECCEYIGRVHNSWMQYCRASTRSMTSPRSFFMSDSTS